MKHITLKQLRTDFEYLEDNLSDYLMGADYLVNHIARGLIDGSVTLREYLSWCIQDIIYYTVIENENEDDIKFLKTDKRAIRILNRYNITLD